MTLVDKSMSKKVTCKICHLQDHTDNRDLDYNLHFGFTVGRGKVMYLLMIWHTTGNVTVFPASVASGHSPRWLSGDALITIHWR